MESKSRLGRIANLDGIALMILIGSLGMNVYLAVARSRDRPTRINDAELLVSGSQAPTFEGTTLAGSKVTLDYRHRQGMTLLYVFSPTCHWCEKNLSNIKAVIDRRPDLRVIGVSVGPKLDDKNANRQPFREIIEPSTGTVQSYHLRGTPATILISQTGVVTHSWIGAYSGQIGDEISAALAVSLPGLNDQQQPSVTEQRPIVPGGAR